MSLADRLFGRRLASHEEEAQRIGPAAGIPMLGLDALSSSAYGPEAALTLLLPLGALGVLYMLPITTVIICLLLIVYFSYRQTIAAYPMGGGSYTVAKENLGTSAGLLAAAALMLDYVLNVAVGISAGVGALVSAFPILHPYILPLCLSILVLIALVNLRGVRESGLAFLLPTYLFVVCLLVVLVLGTSKTLLSGGRPVPTEPGALGYQSVLSQLVGAVVGRGVFYYVTIGAVLTVLALSANTSFAGFPRLCQIVARDDFLPHAFATRGRRLVFSLGIYVLTAFAAVLLMIFGGITDRLIPLFAVGAFLAFTLSQAGMVAHWRRVNAPDTWRNMLVNGVGATATAITLAVVLVAKFAEGAWITLLLIPGMLVLFTAVNRHYVSVARELAYHAPLDLRGLRHPIVIVPMKGWDHIAHKSLRFALKLSDEVYAVQVRSNDKMDDLKALWPEMVEAPTRMLGIPPPHLMVIESPYRRLVGRCWITSPHSPTNTPTARSP